jgi:hypothetical protein
MMDCWIARSFLNVMECGSIPVNVTIATVMLLLLLACTQWLAPLGVL